jgi:hypothetical protein
MALMRAVLYQLAFHRAQTKIDQQTERRESGCQYETAEQQK